uniref:Uncharacterized protein n=1 Tax=Oryza meridionalis TaxID=40149 RepID=A0A0E0DEE0_9ORYZ
MWCASCLASACAGCTCNLCASALSAISRRSARLAYCGLFAASLVLSFLMRQFATPLLKQIPLNGLQKSKKGLNSLIILVTWEIWNHRNICVFNGANPSVVNVLHAVPSEATLWCLAGASKLQDLLSKACRINTFDYTQPDEWFQMNAVLRVSLGNFLFFAIFALMMIGVKDQNDRRDAWHHGGWIAKIVVWVVLIVLMFCVPNVVITIYEVLSKFGSGLFLLVQVVMLLDFTNNWNDSWIEKDEQNLSSEPDDYACNGLHRHSKQVSMSALILGMLTTVLSVVYSAVRAGSSTTFLSPPSSPRSAMLLTGWTSAASDSSELMDVGWTTVWVRICTEWATAALYIWTLVAPLLFPDRDFS